MNLLAKHFFEYHSFANLPHKAIQLYKTPPSSAGSDQSACWTPKSMIKAGKNQAAPGARANRNNTDANSAAHRHGRPGKLEFREWGERHGEHKSEKLAPHKDALTKFLSCEQQPEKRTFFECDFEDQIFQIKERPNSFNESKSCKPVSTFFSRPKSINCCEILLILTYGAKVQFLAVTIKEVKNLPATNAFARIMLFEGSCLLDQKCSSHRISINYNRFIQGTHDEVASKEVNKSTPLSLSQSGQNTSYGDHLASESFLFHIASNKLKRCHIIIELYDREQCDRLLHPRPIGRCTIGSRSFGSGNMHWVQMSQRIGVPMCMWHKLE